MTEKPYTAEEREIAGEILRYLDQYPEAKDTLDSICQWWLRRPGNEPLRRDVERAVSLLLSQGLVLEIHRPGVPPYYRLNRHQRGEIYKFLKG